MDAVNGKEKWSFSAAAGIRSSAAVSNGRVYFGSDDGQLYALDGETGEEKWVFDAFNAVSSSPAIAGGLVYFADRSGTVHALDIETAEEQWSFDTVRPVIPISLTPAAIVPSPVPSDGVLYFGGGAGLFYASR